MGYIIALVLLVVIVPLLFVLLSRRPSGAGTDGSPKAGGVSPSGPSSDAPTPGAATVNHGTAEAERRIPPG